MIQSCIVRYNGKRRCSGAQANVRRESQLSVALKLWSAKANRVKPRCLRPIGSDSVNNLLNRISQFCTVVDEGKMNATAVTCLVAQGVAY